MKNRSRVENLQKGLKEKTVKILMIIQDRKKSWKMIKVKAGKRKRQNKFKVLKLKNLLL